MFIVALVVPQPEMLESNLELCQMMAHRPELHGVGGDQSATDAKWAERRHSLPVLFPAGPGGEVYRADGEGRGKSCSYAGHTPPSMP